MSVVEFPSYQGYNQMYLDIAKMFNVLGWFSLTIIKMKYFYNVSGNSRLAGIDLVPPQIYETWIRWRFCTTTSIHATKEAHIKLVQLHGFLDPSSVYIHPVDQEENVHSHHKDQSCSD